MARLLIAAVFAAAASPLWAAPVNINTASAAQLDAELHGVGPVIAQRIIDHRRTQGAFASPEALAQVRGIGPKTLSRNRQSILVE